MGLLDYLLIGGILFALVWAIRVCVRNRAKGMNCSGDCANCSCGCGK